MIGKEEPIKFLLKGVIVIVMVSLFLCSAALASTVTINSGNIVNGNEYAPEELVDFTMTISDIPLQTEKITLSTGLQPRNSEIIWHLNSDNVKTTSSLTSGVVELTAANGFPNSFEIHVTGKVPALAKTTTVGKILINQLDDQRVYNYYEVRCLDKNGHELDNPQAASFNVIVTDEVEFEKRASTLSDNEVTSRLIAMYDKGLQEDAWRLLEALEKVQQPDIPIWVPILIGAAGILLGILAGIVIGVKRQRKQPPTGTY